jgi:ABC-type cobalamin/Fe3+-siderophores transport system ATPase subunit
MEPLKPAAREQHPAAREQHPAAREQHPAARELLVAARDLALSYDGRPALAGVSLELHAGEILAVVGANGCGKSSLLRVLARLDGGGRSSGTVAYRAQAAPLAAIRAFVPQRPEVAADFTAREVVRLGRYSVGADESAVARALEAVGLAARADLAFHELSGGERQRVAIARALAQLDQPAGRAGVLILDEPFAGIDPGEVARIARALQALARGGGAVVLSLHDPGLARAIATSALVMRSGRTLAIGAAGEVLTAPRLGEAYGHAMRDADGWIVPELRGLSESGLSESGLSESGISAPQPGPHRDRIQP